MVETALDSFNLNASAFELLDDLLRDLAAPPVRIFGLVVVRREAVEIVDQIRLLGDVDLDRVRAALPVR